MAVYSPQGQRAARPRSDRTRRLGRGGAWAPGAAAGAVAAAALLLQIPPAAGQQVGDDPRDRSYATAIVNQALETERTNVEIPWSNPETGHRGSVVVLRTYYRDGGATPCRDYRRTLERPGSAPVITEGTGCRVGPARWQLDERTARAASAPEPRRSPAAAAPAAEPESPPRETRSAEREEPAPEPPARGREPAADAPAAGAAAAARASTAEPEPPPAFPTYTMPSKAAL